MIEARPAGIHQHRFAAGRDEQRSLPAFHVDGKNLQTLSGGQRSRAHQQQHGWKQRFHGEMVARLGVHRRQLCHNSSVKLAIVGFGNVGRALAHLLQRKRADFPFTITGIHTLRHGTAVDPAGLPDAPEFGPRMASVEEFLDAARADTAVELTTLNPSTGEPAIAHIRAAFARGMHVVTANKGPIAHCYAALRDEALRAGVGFRFESAVMDGAPIFNLWRHTMPGVSVLGFAGALNSTSKVVTESMEHGGSFEEGLAQARRMGITEADGAYDIEGWDSAAKTAALAN